MRLTRLPLNTLKDNPADAEVKSHQLMLRAGLIRRLASGLYSWLPLGLRVLRKVEAVIRQEMDRAGALELQMPSVQPSELWQESGRWNDFGPELLRFTDRHERKFCLGPTHEEVITDIARRELQSYKQLPVNFYQIQMKFRDEIRPRFGVMRAREFTMKDAYSFHLDEKSLVEGYESMRAAYERIFSRLGLTYRVVQADSGAIGGSRSEEFHVLAESGEDAIAYCDEDGFAANLEMVPTANIPGPTTHREQLTQVETPNIRTIAQLSDFFSVAPGQCLKMLLVAGTHTAAIGLLLRGDHELNSIKAERLPAVAQPLRMLRRDEVAEAVGVAPGFVGPIGVAVPLIADFAAAALADFICGANQADQHYRGVNWDRDLPRPQVADLRNAVEGDPSPGGGGRLAITRGIEVGHIFQLGNKYSKSMGATVLDSGGREVAMEMGCYGIGVTRVVAAAIEQNHDDRGIIWPAAIAPYSVVLIPIKMDKSQRVREMSEELYNSLTEAGVEVLFDDRDARPGFKFADADLLGIPHRIVVAEKGLDNGQVEYKNRRAEDTQWVALDDIMDLVSSATG